MTLTPEFKEASARAAIRALRNLEQTAIMLETYAPEIFPEIKIVNGIEQRAFGRVIMESAAEAIRAAWKHALKEAENFPDDPHNLLVQHGEMRNALRKIADLIDSEGAEPLDEAIRIAEAALARPAPEGQSDQVYIETDRGYWRPSARGYTPYLNEAGIWNRTDAEIIISGQSPEKKARLIDVKR